MKELGHAFVRRALTVLIVLPLDREGWDPDWPLEQELKTLQTATRNAQPIVNFKPQREGWLEVEGAIRVAVKERRKEVR